KTNRSSKTSGARHLRRRARDNSFDGFMGPPWPATDVGSEESADRRSTEFERSRNSDPPGLRDSWCDGRLIEKGRSDATEDLGTRESQGGSRPGSRRSIPRWDEPALLA